MQANTIRKNCCMSRMISPCNVGMDQNKSNVLNLLSTPKAVQTVFRLQTDCTGALVHTRSSKGKKAYAFYIWYLPMASRYQFDYSCPHWGFTKSLPEVLYLQLDNAGNQSKNRYLSGFCAFLVQKRIFRKVWIIYIIVKYVQFCRYPSTFFQLVTHMKTLISFFQG